MTQLKASPEKRGKESHAFLSTLIALALIGLCLWASQWQYERGVARHQRNALIASQSILPATTLDQVEREITSAEWRQVEVIGVFDPTHQILLRNRYSQGAYGFDLLTLFTDTRDRSFWVDRGWIAPGKSATVTPELPPTVTTPVTITGRIRLDRSLPQGSFFAVSPGSENLIEKWNARSGSRVQTETFYVDLLSSSNPEMTPKVPVELPELSDGPHMAYALQWIFFAGLVVYGRLLLRRAR
ncbi:MAG TPA: SURF1 family protein [Candidatus Paceibacterota bacterium]|nr:SURF1 family protein [Candidatus Paceibacterota bacterium]